MYKVFQSYPWPNKKRYKQLKVDQLQRVLFSRERSLSSAACHDTVTINRSARRGVVVSRARQGSPVSKILRAVIGQFLIVYIFFIRPWIENCHYNCCIDFFCSIRWYNFSETISEHRLYIKTILFQLSIRLYIYFLPLLSRRNNVPSRLFLFFSISFVQDR